MNAKPNSDPTKTCESIKLGIAAHAKWYYVGRQIDRMVCRTMRIPLSF
jgi:hypothetical protein